jgi:hypothetical protein
LSYTTREMNALGGIGYSSYQLYTRQYELSLEADVSSVSDDEARNGAAQSDSIRLAAKEQSREDVSLPLASYLKRRVALSQQLNKQSGAKEEGKTTSFCPIDQARAASLVGENAPLEWLVADQMGGQTGTPTREDFHAPKAELSFDEPAAFLVAAPSTEAASEGTLLGQEWLLTPNA